MWNWRNSFLLQKVWRYYRSKKILARHREVSHYWEPILKAYFDGEIDVSKLKALKKFSSEKIIWQYWGQGIDFSELPEVVRMCFKSVDKYKGEYEVIRLDDSNIKDYLEFPDFVIEKLNNGTFTKTFFSDLLRVALLNSYGGVWFDATILLTDNFDEKLFKMDYFLYQRDSTVKDRDFWENSYAYYWGWNKDFKVNVLSSVFMANRTSKIVKVLLDLMLIYWKKENSLNDYFCFQILYNDLVNEYLQEEKCQIVSDTIPHLLQGKFNGVLDDLSYETILGNTSIHKMSYFDDNGLKRMKEFINIYQILD